MEKPNHYYVETAKLPVSFRTALMSCGHTREMTRVQLAVLVARGADTSSLPVRCVLRPTADGQLAIGHVSHDAAQPPIVRVPDGGAVVAGRDGRRPLSALFVSPAVLEQLRPDDTEGGA